MGFDRPAVCGGALSLPPRADPDAHWGAGLVLGELPREAARRFGDREALAFRGRRYSFREVADAVDRLARGFMALGIAPGERACIWLLNCPEWMFAMFALARIGAVHVPVNTRFRTADLEYVYRQSGATTLITHDVSGPIDYLAMARTIGPARLVLRTDAPHAGAWRLADVIEAGAGVDPGALEARAAAVRPTDTMLVMYTSGTTGFPKGVMRDHSLIRSMIDRIRRLGTCSRDVIVNYLPLFHIFGYVDGPLCTMLAGHRQVLTETFDADETLDLVESEGATQLHGFETHFKAIVDAQEARPRRIGTLRSGILAAGMASAAPTAYRARTVLAPMRPVTAYGITEVGANVSMSDADATDEQACETSGYACEGFELRVIDPETGRDQPTGTPGELIVRTRYLMQGYHDKPEETARAVDAAGWFHTGDMALLRPDGYMRFIGRYKDMLKVGGENVDPVEVERHLLSHPGVLHVAVVGYPDPRLVEIPVAFVIRAPGHAVSADDLVAACRGRIASFKIPRHVVFVDELPTTSSGKVQKVVLRADALRRLGPA